MGQPFTTDHDGGCGRNLDEEIAWFVENHLTCEKPFIPTLRRMWGLSALEAVEVMRLANLRLYWGGR